MTGHGIIAALDEMGDRLVHGAGERIGQGFGALLDVGAGAAESRSEGVSFQGVSLGLSFDELLGAGRSFLGRNKPEPAEASVVSVEVNTPQMAAPAQSIHFAGTPEGVVNCNQNDIALHSSANNGKFSPSTGATVSI